MFFRITHPYLFWLLENKRERASASWSLLSKSSASFTSWTSRICLNCLKRLHIRLSARYLCCRLLKRWTLLNFCRSRRRFLNQSSENHERETDKEDIKRRGSRMLPSHCVLLQLSKHCEGNSKSAVSGHDSSRFASQLHDVFHIDQRLSISALNIQGKSDRRQRWEWDE